MRNWVRNQQVFLSTYQKERGTKGGREHIREQAFSAETRESTIDGTHTTHMEREREGKKRGKARKQRQESTRNFEGGRSRTFVYPSII
jgi:hypothetical protein